MSNILRILPFWSLIASVSGMLSVWFLLPWISIAGVTVFQSYWVRITLCALVLLVVLLVNWLRTRKENRKESRFLSDLEQYSSGAITSEAQFQQIFSEVFSALNVKGKGKKRVYEVPWYLVIGTPGSGKSTLLRKSGLDFVDTKEALEKKGIAGTSLCDWWVSPDIVLLDTAGRLTSQDHQATDASDWSILLDKLKKFRPLQPLNGVLLTIPVDTLLISDKTNEFIDLATKRLNELSSSLDIRLPVYFIVTKTDLLPGFDACFHHFDAKQRSVIWGYSLDTDGQVNTGSAESLILALKHWIYAQQAVLRQDEAQQEIIFYQHLVGICKVVGEFITVFPSNLVSEALLRSVFFTSATQYGNPVEKIVSSVLTDLCGKKLSDLTLRSTPKSYFIKDVFTQVIYGEASLAGHALSYLRKRKYWTIGLLLASMTVIGGANIVWWQASTHINQQISHVEQKFEQLVTESKKARSIKDVLSLLVQLDELAKDIDNGQFEKGLYLDDEISSGIALAKQNIFESSLIPNLSNKIRDYFVSHMRRQWDVYSSLKAYLMLSSGRYYDAEFLKNWLRQHSQVIHQQGLNEEQQTRLYQYTVSAINITREREYRLDIEAVQLARKELNTISTGLRLLQALESRHDIPDWDGSFISWTKSIEGLLTRTDKKPLVSLPSSLYSKAGMLWLIQQDIHEMADTYTREGWVLSDSDDLKSENSQAIVNAMMLDYIIRYTKVWQNYLERIKLRREPELSRLVVQLEQLSQAQSDFSLWLNHILKQLYLPENLKEVNKLANFERLIQQQLDHQFEKLLAWSDLEKEITGITRMNDKFFRTKALLEKQVIEPSFQKQQQLMISRQFEILVTELPSPLDQWFRSLSNEADTVLTENAALAANLAWQDKLGRCKVAINGQYPFFRKSKTDMPLKDFTSLFSQTGLMGGFHSEYADVLERSKSRDSFSLSQKISDNYFIGGNLPGFDFSVRLRHMSSAITKLFLTIGNESFSYDFPDGKWIHMRWPLHSGASEVMIKLVDEFGLTIWERRFYGLWALHRMVEELSIHRLSGRNFELKKARKEWAFSLEIQAPENNNLLLLKDLRRFRCPETL